jgi:subtilisin family serine protease
VKTSSSPTVKGKELETPPKKPAQRLTKRAPGVTGADPEKAAKEGKMSYTGKGVKVGVIDSGIDLEHSGFRGRIQKQVHYYSGCDKDVDGHGTHVAGIIGAQDNFFQGVAPDVEFGVYNVFPCSDKDKGTSDDIILKALEDAQKDGMNIINMSLGSLDWEEGALGQMASKMFEQHNILVISSHGNRGEEGLFRASGPGVGRNVLATGACKSLDSTKENIQSTDEPSRTISADTSSLKSLGVNMKDITVHKGTLDWENEPLTTLDAAEDEFEFCNEGGQPGQFKGKIVLLRSGGCSADMKTRNLADSGAIGLLFSVKNMIPFESSLPQVKEAFPIASIRNVQGSELRKKLQDSPSTSKPVAPKPARKLSKYSASLDFKCDDMAYFSSWGPTPEFGIKPEISAPVSLGLFSSWMICR